MSDAATASTAAGGLDRIQPALSILLARTIAHSSGTISTCDVSRCSLRNLTMVRQFSGEPNSPLTRMMRCDGAATAELDPALLAGSAAEAPPCTPPCMLPLGEVPLLQLLGVQGQCQPMCILIL